jgi:hypothetical protein
MQKNILSIFFMIFVCHGCKIVEVQKYPIHFTTEDISGEYSLNTSLLISDSLSIKRDSTEEFWSGCVGAYYYKGTTFYDTQKQLLSITNIDEESGEAQTAIYQPIRHDSSIILLRVNSPYTSMTEQYKELVRSFNEKQGIEGFFIKKTQNSICKKPILPKEYDTLLLKKPISCQIIKRINDTTVLLNMGSKQGLYTELTLFKQVRTSIRIDTLCLKVGKVYRQTALAVETEDTHFTTKMYNDSIFFIRKGDTLKSYYETPRWLNLD